MQKLKVLSTLILLIFIGVSCEKNPSYEDDDLINSTDLEFHNPSSIAFVKEKGESARKFNSIEYYTGYYYLYEIVNGNLERVTSKDGHELYFSGVETVSKINSTWQMVSPDLFDGLKIYKVYSNRTLTYDVGFNTLFFNVETGELYDLEERVLFWDYEESYNETFFYDSINNHVYFRIRRSSVIQPFCRLDLNNMALEVFELPFGVHGRDVWCLMDEMIFYTSTMEDRKFLCYKPNVGYTITKTNALDSPPQINITMCYQGKESVYFGFCRNYYENTDKYAADGNMIINFLSMHIQNDSMIFDTITPTIVGYHPAPHNFFTLYPENICPIYHKNQKWHFYQNCIWSYDDINNIYSAIEIDHIPTKVLSDGENHFGLDGAVIYKYDLDVLSTSEFITINTADMQIKDVYIGHETTLYVEGLRLSDLKDIYLEFDGETGEKLNEWIAEEAPPQSSITYLSPI